MNMFLKAILLANCMAGIVFADPESRLGRNLQSYFRKIEDHFKPIKENCNTRVHHIILDANSCNSSIYQTMFCQVNRALKHINKPMCKNVTEILPSKFEFGDGMCNLPADRILMKDFLPKLRDFVEKLFRKCAQPPNTV